MKSKGKVEAIHKDKVTVSVVREGACGENCASCHGCSGRTVSTEAFCSLDVAVGDVVEIFSNSEYVYLGLILVFLMPIVFPLIMYLIFLNFSKTVSVLFTVLSFIISLVGIYRLSKSKKFLTKVTPRVTAVLYKK